MRKITPPKSILVTDEMKQWLRNVGFGPQAYEHFVKAFEYVRKIDPEKPGAPGGVLCYIECPANRPVRMVVLPIGEPAKDLKYAAYAQWKTWQLVAVRATKPFLLSTFQLDGIPGGGVWIREAWYFAFSGLSPLGDEAVVVIGSLMNKSMSPSMAQETANISNNWIIEKYLKEQYDVFIASTEKA